MTCVLLELMGFSTRISCQHTSLTNELPYSAVFRECLFWMPQRYR